MIRSLSAALLILLPAVALAEDPLCAKREALMKSLAKDYQEAPTALGVSDSGNVIELLTTRDGRTWTLLMTMPSGTSCVVATGEAWQQAPQMAMGQEM